MLGRLERKNLSDLFQAQTSTPPEHLRDNVEHQRDELEHLLHPRPPHFYNVSVGSH